MKQKHYFETYIDKQKEHRWRMVSIRNKKTVADSAEGYKTKAGVLRAIKSINYGGLEVKNTK